MTTRTLGPARASAERVSPTRQPSGGLRRSDVILRILIVGLTLATGYIHTTLGGLLFNLNGLGYAVAAVAMVIPLGIAIGFRWLVRIGLMGYAATAIVAWYLIGPRYDIAYMAKGIEVALIVLLAVDFVRHDGSPLAVLRRLRSA